MAGGRGERLRPLTDTVPKPLLRVRGGAILDLLLEAIARAGVRRAHVATGYLGDAVARHLSDAPVPGLEVRARREEQPLGTAGAVGLVAGGLSGPLLVCNGDIVTDLDFGALIKGHAAAGCAVTVVGVAHEQRLPFGGLEVDRAGRLTGWREGEIVRRIVSAGIYVLEPEAARMVRAGERVDMPELIGRCAGMGVRVEVHGGAWDDVGEHEALERWR